MGNILAYYISNGNAKIRTQKNGRLVTTTHIIDFEKHFPGDDLLSELLLFWHHTIGVTLLPSHY